MDESPCLDDWEVPAWSIGVIDKLGEGEFGEVFKGELCSETANRKMVAYAKKNTYLAVKLLKGRWLSTTNSSKVGKCMIIIMS